MQTLKFQFPSSSLEDKAITIRKYRPEAHSFVPGEVILASFEDATVPVIVTDWVVCKAKEIDHEDLVEDGFTDHADMYQKMSKYYTDFGPETDAVVICYATGEDLCQTTDWLGVLLNDRDEFIAEAGLWEKYVESLPDRLGMLDDGVVDVSEE